MIFPICISAQAVLPEPPEFIPPTQEKLAHRAKRRAIFSTLVALLMVASAVAVCVLAYRTRMDDVRAYEVAVQSLFAREYERALEQFDALGDFSDAASQAQKLRKQQEDYEYAEKLLEDRAFDEAVSAFSALGDYRESENYVNFEIAYQRALYRMESAEVGDADAWRALWGADAGVGYAESALTYDLYTAAAQEFSSLGDYRDSEMRASACRLALGRELIDWGEYDEALAYLPYLNEADTDALWACYDDACADRTFLTDVCDALALWADGDLQGAREKLAPFAGRNFHDEGLSSLCTALNDAFAIAQSAVSASGSVRDYTAHTYAELRIYAVAQRLHDGHGAFAEDEALCERLLGKTEHAFGRYAAEKCLRDWSENAEVSLDKEKRYCLNFDNTTDYTITLHISVTLSDDASVILSSDEQTVTVKPNESVRIFRSKEMPHSWHVTWEILDVSK